MRFQKKMLASLSAVSLGAILALGFLAEAKADATNTDPSGTWSWTMKGRQRGPDRKVTLKLKVDGSKVTGTISMPGRGGQTNEAEIKDGKVTGDEVTFNVVRERNGNTITTKYNGKISGDTIKGKMEFERNGEPVKRDWEAKRGDGK